MIRPGARNLITDVPGIRVGNAEDHAVQSGVTVVLAEPAAVCAVDVRGGAPGTRETDAFDPACLVERADAVVLSGGSAFGLDAAGGVMAWLATRGRGFRAGAATIPLVPAAILFDLHDGPSWGEAPPYRALALRACDAAGPAFALGNAGAGLGARAGTLKGGLGSASFVLERRGGSLTVGALAAVNALGSVTIPESAVFWAWPFEQDAEFGGRRPADVPRPLDLDVAVEGALGTHTTLVVVATDAMLDKAQARRLAIMAHDGLARAIRPAHTPMDGDSLFVLATGRQPLDRPAADLARLGTAAADCVSRAIARGVYEAADLDGVQSYRSRFGSGAPRISGQTHEA